ncbi:uncharacterized protein [Cicer arietinum]|uniref:uncharacterized protein n=1 Tax=Cicer arietinum TaxID=3827 RepID=UPI003CC6617E
MHFPTFIHQYIEDIIDIVPDGNCGFRANAALLGWTVEPLQNSLKISGFHAQGKDKWMTIPNLGYVIATGYNVILVSLSRNLNITFFPLNKAPSKESSLISLLAIRFVNENYWIKLKSDLPLPPTSQKWRDFCSECAKTWEIAYVGPTKSMTLRTSSDALQTRVDDGPKCTEDDGPCAAVVGGLEGAIAKVGGRIRGCESFKYHA